MIRKTGYLTAFIMPALCVAGFMGGGLWNFIAPVFAIILLPVLDSLAGENPSNVPAPEATIIANQRYYRVVTFVWAYVQVALLTWGCFAVTSGRLQTPLAWVGFTLGFALTTGGIGITVAHELGHKKSGLERFYSRLLLLTVWYMHFYIEHNRGHHVAVATPEDPATARRNESYYAFWPRTVFGSYFHAWKLEGDRLARRGRPLLSLTNSMIWYTLLPVLLAAALTLAFSLVRHTFAWQVPVFYAVQSVLAFSLLELVNYIEHYGIRRMEVSPGKYEKVNASHSWNTTRSVSNFFLFQLQRHSDHHLFAHKRYQVLDNYADSPQLPHGYPAMIVVALIPPLWFALMNPRLEAAQGATVH